MRCSCSNAMGQQSSHCRLQDIWTTSGKHGTHMPELCTVEVKENHTSLQKKHERWVETEETD